MRVAVTGASGMLGRALLQRFDNVDWIGIDLRPQPDVVRENVQHHIQDVRDTPSLVNLFQDVDIVVHAAAALPSHPAQEITSVDVEGTRSVLEAAERNSVQHVVHISSTAVYGLPQQCPTPEDYPLTAVDSYNTAKIQAEIQVQRYRERGSNITILRPKTFLGPERLGIFAMLFEWADEGRNFPLIGGGNVLTQMLDVSDLCDVIYSTFSATDEIKNDTFNVGASEYGTLAEDFQSVLDFAGHGKRIKGIPGGFALPLLNLLAATGGSPVYKRLLYKLTADSYVSIEKARELLSYEPRFSNRQSLLRTYEWWKRHPEYRAPGRTHRDAWKQGVLAWAKVLY